MPTAYSKSVTRDSYFWWDTKPATHDSSHRSCEGPENQDSKSEMLDTLDPESQLS